MGSLLLGWCCRRMVWRVRALCFLMRTGWPDILYNKLCVNRSNMLFNSITILLSNFDFFRRWWVCSCSRPSAASMRTCAAAYGLHSEDSVCCKACTAWVCLERRLGNKKLTSPRVRIWYLTLRRIEFCSTPFFFRLYWSNLEQEYECRRRTGNDRAVCMEKWPMEWRVWHARCLYLCYCRWNTSIAILFFELKTSSSCWGSTAKSWQVYVSPSLRFCSLLRLICRRMVICHCGTEVPHETRFPRETFSDYWTIPGDSEIFAESDSNLLYFSNWNSKSFLAAFKSFNNSI